MILFVSSIVACSSNRLPWSNDSQKQYARQLQERGMYKQAVAAYNELAEKGGLSGRELAGVYYLMANTCFDSLHDYETALQYYLKSNISGPHGGMTEQIQKRIIECLERLGKASDAQRELDRTTLSAANKPLAGDTVVAVIGKRNITMSEINDALRMMPDYLQKEYTAGQKKLEFLQHYIFTELLYDSAKRRGLETNPDIMKAAEQMKKNIMVEALLAEEMKSKVQVNDTEISLYYQAHQAEYRNKKLDDVRADVAGRVAEEKKQSAYRELLSRFMRAEQVVIYDEYFTDNKNK
jgi:tetratricopeptide (TPR) repeat protein